MKLDSSSRLNQKDVCHVLFRLFPDHHIDKTHQCTVNKNFCKRGNFLYYSVQYCGFMFSKLPLFAELWFISRIGAKKEKLMMVANIKLKIFPLCTSIGLTTFLLLPFYVQANFHRQIEFSPSLSYLEKYLPVTTFKL